LVERDLVPRLLRVPPVSLDPVVASIDFAASFAMLVAPFNVSVVPFDIVFPKPLKYSDQVFVLVKKPIL
jgi:hypothetical protein